MLTSLIETLRFVAKLQTLYPHWNNASQIQQKREQRLRELLAHAAAHSPFYQRRFAGIDLATCALSDLPTLTKSEMMDNFDDVVTDRRLRKHDLAAFVQDPRNLGRYYLGRYGVSHTSGSQGQPALIVQDHDALALVFAVQFARGTPLKRRILPHIGRVINPARMALITMQPGFYPSASSFAYLPAFLRPMLKILHLSISDPMAENVRRIEEFRPDYITGYGSAIDAFAHEEAEGRMNLRSLHCLSQINNVAEPLPDHTAEHIQKVFGVPVVDEYAMGECLTLSSGCIKGRGSHLNADLAILEVVDENNRPVPPGTEGSKVLMTNLTNHVQPFIRYEVDDRVTMSPSPCQCGSVLPKIDRVRGRSKDLLWFESTDGRRELPYYVIMVALHREFDMAEHQVVQVGAKKFLLRVAPLKGKQLSADRIRGFVLEALKTEGLDQAFEFDVVVVDEIPRGPSGKIARTKNEYAPMLG